ncbi:MAG: D-alanyl-lipoteichoic acid biosynthesis protein DltD [Vagococcus sp.]
MIPKKKLVQAIGPFLVAILILGVIIYSPIKLFSKPSSKAVHESASSMSVNVLKGNALKNEAMSTEHYLPFFGSSELSRVNALHPSVLAKKYHRNYEPFLLGAPGTQSMTHFFMMNSMSSELKNRKAVFVISPQWFVKEGVGDPMFSLFYSPLQTYQWLKDLDTVTENDTYLAKRLLTFNSIKTDTQMKLILNKVAKGESLSSLDKKNASYKFKVLLKEDMLFSKVGIKSKSEKIDKKTSQLPDSYSLQELDKLAYDKGEQVTNNNEFGISNKFYSKRIAPIKGSLKNSQVHFNYIKSPEYADFQLVLNEIAENNMDVLFVIPPVNKCWSDYTGLSTEMLDEFSVKINEQLKSQGFNHVVDFTDKRSEPYFMEDTIHLGWRGWVELDKELQAFLADKEQPTYHMNSNTYLNRNWTQKTVNR